MFSMKKVAAVALLVAVAGQADPAEASHRRHRIDAEIDSLDACLVRSRCGGWILKVEYEVEIECGRGAGPFELHLVLGDRRGRPIVMTVPLNRPYRVKRGEIEFRGRRSFRLPRGFVCNPRRLNVCGKLIGGLGGRVLDVERERVDVRGRW